LQKAWQTKLKLHIGRNDGKKTGDTGLAITMTKNKRLGSDDMFGLNFSGRKQHYA